MLTDTVEYDLRKWLSKWFPKDTPVRFHNLKQQNEVTKCTNRGENNFLLKA